MVGESNWQGVKGRGWRRTAGCKQEISRCSSRNERAARPRILKSYCREGVACCVANVNAATFIPYEEFLASWLPNGTIGLGRVSVVTRRTSVPTLTNRDVCNMEYVQLIFTTFPPFSRFASYGKSRVGVLYRSQTVTVRNGTLTFFLFRDLHLMENLSKYTTMLQV